MDLSHNTNLHLIFLSLFLFWLLISACLSTEYLITGCPVAKYLSVCVRFFERLAGYAYVFGMIACIIRVVVLSRNDFFIFK